MERAAWTDERLDDLAETMRHGFDRIDRDLRDLRTELHGDLGAMQTELHGDLGAMQTELHGDLGAMRGETRGAIAALGTELRAEIEGLRQTMIRIGGGMLIGFISVLAAILARGA